VLDRHHAGVNAFLYRDFQRHVSGDRELLPPRLVDNSKEHVSRREVVHLNQIHTAAFEELNCSFALIRVPDADPERPVPRRIVEDWSCRHDPGPERAARGGGISDIEDEVEVRPHVADAGHAVGDVQRQPSLFVRLDVRVHVPETRYEEFALTVYHLCIGGKSAILRDA
jgi:hypothetical protein